MQEHNNRPERGPRGERRFHGRGGPHGPEGEHHGPGRRDFEGHAGPEGEHDFDPREQMEHLREAGRHFHHGRNFWHDWRDERDRRDERRHHGHGGEEDFEIGQALSPKEMEAWREFFHQSFGTWPEDHWIFGGRRFSPWHQGMDTFNPFVASLLSKGGGLLPLYVLHLVAQQPRYGNAIMDILAERTNGQWVSNPGAIYPLLTLLEREGFIQGEWADPAKRSVRVYTITAKGQEELTRIKTIVAPKVAETINVLEVFLQDLQGQSQPAADADAAAGSEASSQEEA